MKDKIQKQSIEKINVPVSIVFLAEHVPEIMVKDVSKKVVKWLKENRIPSEMERILEDEESEIERTKVMQTKGVRADESEFWEDNFDTYGLMIDFYKDSFRKKVDRIIYTNDNSFSHLIGVRGYPNAQKIIEYFVKNGEVVVTGSSIFDYPKDLLRDGVGVNSIYFHANGVDIDTKKKSYKIKFKEMWVGGGKMG